MNERFNWRIQAAEMRNFLAEQYKFVSERFRDLGMTQKADKSHNKEIRFRQEADNFREEAERSQTSFD